MILRELNIPCIFGIININSSKSWNYLSSSRKLQEKGLIQQRDSKEYELTLQRAQTISFLKKLDEDDVL